MQQEVPIMYAIYFEDPGVCSAALSNPHDGVTGGQYGGRFCWAIGCTYCVGEVRGTLAQKFVTCRYCDVLKGIYEDEGHFFTLTPKGR